MSTISGDAALAEFRERLTGAYGLSLVPEEGGGVLVAKKCFVEECCKGIAERFAEMEVNVDLVTEGWTPEHLENPSVVPIISYGMIGTNLFENFDCVYYLTGYYVNELVVNKCLQDITRQDLRLPIRIDTGGIPPGVRCRVALFFVVRSPQLWAGNGVSFAEVVLEPPPAIWLPCHERTRSHGLLRLNCWGLPPGKLVYDLVYVGPQNGPERIPVYKKARKKGRHQYDVTL